MIVARAAVCIDNARTSLALSSINMFLFLQFLYQVPLNLFCALIFIFFLLLLLRLLRLLLLYMIIFCNFIHKFVAFSALPPLSLLSAFAHFLFMDVQPLPIKAEKPIHKCRKNIIVLFHG